MRLIGSVLVLCSLVVLQGCAKKNPNWKQTFKVTGKVTVDGQPPMSPIQIVCHDITGIDKQKPSVSQCDTADDGTFEIATYTKGDGVPVGEYKLTFTWQEFSLMSRGYSGPDKLKKRYSDPAKSEIKFSVVDKPVKLDNIELTTK